MDDLDVVGVSLGHAQQHALQFGALKGMAGRLGSRLLRGARQAGSVDGRVELAVVAQPLLAVAPEQTELRGV